MRSVLRISPLVLLLALGACAKRVKPPDARPGANITVNAGTFVQLDGGSSTDPGGRPLAYSWSFLSVPLGSQAVLRDAQSQKPSFLADVPGDYLLQLIVSNSVLVSAPQRVTVTASGCGVNAPVIEQITTSNGQPSIGSTVQLGARVSSADNAAACGSLNETFSWKWSLKQLPAGSTAVLNAPSSETPSLRTDQNGDFVVQLVVTASNGRSSAPTLFTVHTTDCGASIGATASIGLTTAAQGPGPLSVPPLTTVQLGATPADADLACTLPDSLVTWQWQVTSRPAGSSAMLLRKTTAAPVFTPDVAGTYEFSVQATDSLSGVASAAAFVSLVALPCDGIAPSVNKINVLAGGLLGESTQVAVDTVTDFNCLANPSSLTAGSTGAADPTQYRYAWRLVSSPTGSSALLQNPAAQKPSFTPDLVGTYQLAVVVTNSRGVSSAPVYLPLPVQPCGTAALSWPSPAITRAVTDPQPVAGDTQIHAGDSIKLGAQAINPNACAADSSFALTTTYRWSLFSIPRGSKAVLSTNTGGSTVFIADVPGIYQYGVVATDSLGNTSPVAYDTVITSTCGVNPVSVGIAPATTVTTPVPINTYAPQQLTEIFPAGVVTFDNQNDPTKPNYCPARFQQAVALAWSIPNSPGPGTAALSDLAGSSTVFSGSVPGNYAVRLTATAGNGQSGSALSYIFVKPCGSTPPSITSTGTTVGGVQTSRPPVGSTVMLNATAVSPDTLNPFCGGFTTTLTYQWTLVSAPAGSSATGGIAGGAASYSFVADLAGTYVFEVVATDAHGLSSTPATITVPTGSCGPTIPAAATFSAVFDGNRSAIVGNSLFLTAPAAGITDACVANATYTYSWQLSSRPGTSATALSAAAGTTTTMIADTPGAYVVTLTVTDSGGFSSQVSQTYNIGACTSGPTPAAGYTSPAGAGGTVYLGDQVSLTPGTIVAGSCNHLASQAYTYSWAMVAKPAGSVAQLSSTSAASPVFVPDVAGGTYQLAVTVRDGLGNTGTSSVSVKVSPCGGRAPTVGAPTAVDGKTSAAIAVTAAGGGYSLSQPTWDPIAFTGSATSPDNNTNPALGVVCPAAFQTTLTYAWQVVSAPVGAQFSLGGATTPTPTFAPAAKGSYQLQLVVTDGRGNKTPPLPINVSILCGDAVPTAVDNGATPAFSASQTMHNIIQKRTTGVTTGDLTVTASTLQAASPAFYPGSPIKLGANAQDADTTCGFPQTISYTWAFTSTPLGSQVVFDSAISPTPSFVPDKAGDYYVQLTLKDTKGAQGVQVFPASGAAILHVGNCGSQTPVALIGLQDPYSPAPTTTVGATNGYAVLMDGTSSYTLDNAPVDFTGTSGVIGCGYNKALTYQWAFVSMPAGASVAFNDPTRVNPAFTPQTSGSYAISLTASDGVRTSLPATVQVVTADASNGALDFYAAAGATVTLSQPTGQQQHFNTFRIEPGANVYLASGQNGGLLDIIVSGDVYIGGTLNLSGSPGMPGPNGDVSWQGSGGGDTGWPLSNHGTPTAGAGCSGTGSQITITQAVGGSGSAGAAGPPVVVGGVTQNCGGGLGGSYGGGGGGGSSGGGGGGYGGGGGGGGNSCAGNIAGGAGGGAYGGAGGAIAQGGRGGVGGGAPYDGAPGINNALGDCTNTGYGGGGGGGSIGTDAASDLAMASTLRAGSAGGGGAGDEGRGGGGGGGAVRIVSTSGSVTVTGQILASGGAGGDSGGDPTCCQGGSGGGGSGGAIWLQATTGSVYNAGTISAAGGRGGQGQSSRGGGGAASGGAGGLGRIKLAGRKISNYGILNPPLASAPATATPGNTYYVIMP